MMKKLFVLTAVCAAMFLMISCGDDSVKKVYDGTESVKNAGELGGECLPDETCNEGLRCDTEQNLCVEGETTDDNDANDNEDTNKDEDATEKVDDDTEPAETRDTDCDPKPENTEWNTVSTITQTFNGEEWVPSEASVYNPEPSTTECRFKCKENYTWDEAEEKCQADTRVSDCTGLPKGAKWNEYSSIKQTWNGTAWEPDTKGVYNNQADQKECRYVCDTHYTWTNSVCKADTRDAECTGKPENSYWNTADEISQTWNGTAWEPSEIGTYSKDPSEDHCFFICKSGLTFDEATSTCTGPCEKCKTAEHAVESGKCIETASDEYSCECEKPYFWNGTKCKEMPECSTANVTPCRNGDDENYLIWSKKATDTMKWANAQTYCEKLTEGGFDDWRLPTISELRTLILNCPGSMPDGNCKVKDPGCLSLKACYTDATCSCSEDSSGKYSVFGETDILWSSSTRSDADTSRWRVDFDSAKPYSLNKELDYGTVRCVR